MHARVKNIQKSFKRGVKMKSPLKYAPLSSGFMVVSIIGFLVSVWMVMGWSESCGFTLALFFVLMFIAAIVSMTKAEPIQEHMDELAIHRPKIIYPKRDTSPHYRGIQWYEPLLWIYFAVWMFFMVESFSKTAQINQTFGILFMICTVCLMIFFIEDAISNERFTRWEQFMFTMILVFTAGFGIFVYYIYKRIKS
jgi:hypothetical protein